MSAPRRSPQQVDRLVAMARELVVGYNFTAAEVAYELGVSRDYAADLMARARAGARPLPKVNQLRTLRILKRSRGDQRFWARVDP